MELFIKACAGAAIVIIIQLLSRTRNYYIAGLVPLFPTFGLISHYIVGNQRTTGELKETILFGMFSLVPYFSYLAALYLLIDKFSLISSLLGAVIFWTITATALVVIWNKIW